MENVSILDRHDVVDIVAANPQERVGGMLRGWPIATLVKDACWMRIWWMMRWDGPRAHPRFSEQALAMAVRRRIDIAVQLCLCQLELPHPHSLRARSTK